MSGLRIHHRESIVRTAKIELQTYVAELIKRHKLTDGEILSIINESHSDWFASYAKVLIRMERHGDPDACGGLEGG